VDEFIQQNSERPNIEGMVVVLVLNHFWCHVLEGAAEGEALLHVVGLDTPPEVADLDYVLVLDEDVLWLDVSVD